MIRKLILIFLLLDALNSAAQGNYEAKLMSWNLLNWPSTSNFVSDTTFRCPAYRTVVNYIQPDVLITMENTSTSSQPLFLNQVMNTGPYHYAAGTFINGYDTDNAIYYRDSLFTFVSNQPVHTSLRDISHFTLIYIATGDTIHIFSCHLKASQGYEVQRSGEVADLRQVTNALPAGTSFLIGGDFNIYNSAEPAYVGLLQDDVNNDGNFLDPIHLNGIWNNPSYSPYHTQSTHRSSTTGGYAGGGMNDRFDMILYSNAVEQPGGVYFIPGSYLNVGNDGNHYNDDINWGVNTAVPAPVADALYDASDHLPITVMLGFGPTSGIDETAVTESDVKVFPEPVTENSVVQVSLLKNAKVQFIISDYVGRTICSSGEIMYGAGNHSLPIDWTKLKNNGFYLLSIKFDNMLISKKIVLIK